MGCDKRPCYGWPAGVQHRPLYILNHGISSSWSSSQLLSRFFSQSLLLFCSCPSISCSNAKFIRSVQFLTSARITWIQQTIIVPWYTIRLTQTISLQTHSFEEVFPSLWYTCFSLPLSCRWNELRFLPIAGGGGGGGGGGKISFLSSTSIGNGTDSKDMVVPSTNITCQPFAARRTFQVCSVRPEYSVCTKISYAAWAPLTFRMHGTVQPLTFNATRTKLKIKRWYAFYLVRKPSRNIGFVDGLASARLHHFYKRTPLFSVYSLLFSSGPCLMVTYEPH